MPAIFKNKWMMMLAVCGIYSIITSAITSFDENVAFILSFVLYGPMFYGIARTTIECVENRPWDISHAFKGFEEDFVGSLVLGVLEQLFIALWSLLLIVPGIIKSYSYAMALYIKQEPDGKNKDAIDCIKESREMMDGYKWQLFCLDFSFLGWYFLGVLCLGVGVFFVAPYHYVARANFYEALKAERMINGGYTQFTQTPPTNFPSNEDF